jgi:hypothetical protein
MHPLFIKSSAITSDVIGAAIEVHRDKGPGLLESIEANLARCQSRLDDGTKQTERTENTGSVFSVLSCSNNMISWCQSFLGCRNPRKSKMKVQVKHSSDTIGNQCKPGLVWYDEPNGLGIVRTINRRANGPNVASTAFGRLQMAGPLALTNNFA